MAIRIKTMGRPAFRHGGLVVGDRWMEVTDLEDPARNALRDFHGKYVMVHPDDVGKLEQLGLKLVDKKGPLVDTRKVAEKKSDAKVVEKKADKGPPMVPAATDPKTFTTPPTAKKE